MSIQELLEEILNHHKEKNIISYSKKLLKKCSFNSGECARNLCNLAYWLYVYGYEDEVIALCEITHDVEFPGKGKFNVWDYLLLVWGLEVYILKKNGRNDEAEDRIRIMDSYWKSSPLSEQEEIDRRNRFTYEYAAKQDKILNETSKTYANSYRILALTHLIGLTYTGLFPKLWESKELVDKTIDEYISILKEAYRDKNID
ncbi:MAG: hypothetical protein NC240_00040 [Clostridium sp.]|nr:hypothetical protein [Clostridium sp.]